MDSSTAVKPLNEVETALTEFYDARASKYLSWMNSPYYPTIALRYLDRLMTLVDINTPTTPSSSDSESNETVSCVLELGCGGGVPITKTLAQTSSSITAVDLSAEQLRLARKYVPEENVNFIQSSMTHLTFDANTFDAALAMYSIFHLSLPDQEHTMKNLYKWLKPGGFLLINFADTKTAKEGQWLEWLGGQSFIASAGSEGSKKMVEDAGFEVCQYEILMDEQVGKMVCAWIVARKPQE